MNQKIYELVKSETIIVGCAESSVIHLFGFNKVFIPENTTYPKNNI